MSNYLFPSFLHDTGEYQKAEEFWKAIWQKVVSDPVDSAQWLEPYFSTSFADGTPCRDGNPIFSAASPLRERAIRIIQVEPAGNPLEMSFWTDVVGEEGKIRELVIACVLCLETAAVSEDLIKQWVKTGTAQIAFRIRLATESQVSQSRETVGFGLGIVGPNDQFATLTLRSGDYRQVRKRATAQAGVWDSKIKQLPPVGVAKNSAVPGATVSAY